MELSVLREPLDGGDVGALGLNREHRACLDRAAVDVHDAGAALAGVAPHVGSGQPQVLAQEFHEEGAILDLTGDRPPVHVHGDIHRHTLLSS